MEQFPGERKESIIRNLREHTADTIRAMAEVEGPAWFTAQDAMEKGVSSEGEYETSLPNALERLDAGKSTTVYGKGGINRWEVGGDGTVKFSRSHTQSEDILHKAEELGFEIGS